MLGIAGRDRLCLRPGRSVRESSCGDDCVSAHMRYDLGDEVQRENHQRSTAGRFRAYAGSEHVLVDGRHDATSMTEVWGSSEPRVSERNFGLHSRKPRNDRAKQNSGRVMALTSYCME
jgi:hypothetical protein